MDKRQSGGIFPVMRISHQLVRLAAVVIVSLAGAPRLAAQDTTSTANLRPTPDSQRVKITLSDGSVLIGRVLEITPLVVRFASAAGESTIPRQAIRSVEPVEAAAMHNGEYWPEDPSRTRLFFAPTGRMQRRGEVYFSDAYVVFPSFQAGLASRLSLGAGMSVIPGLDLDEQVFYVTPKVGVVASPKLNVAVGALVAGAGGYLDEGPFGIGYGVATYGGEDASVTTGVGFGFDRGNTSHAILMLGGSARVSRNLAVLTENYYFTDERNSGLVSFGFRFMGERIAVDVAAFTPSGTDFVVIPYLAFIYRL